jgi:hypothetical protein
MIKKTTLLLTDTICFVSRLPTRNRGVQHWRSGLLQIWFYLYDSSEALQDIGINNQAISKR